MWKFALSILMLSFLVGCQQTVTTDYHKLNLANVKGQVTLDGNPVPDAHIMFESADKTYSFAKTDASGYYTLKFNMEKDGILPGAKTVRIRKRGAFGAEGALLGGNSAPAASHVGGEGEGSDPDEGQAESGPSSQVGELHVNYNDQSQLTVTVQDGSQTMDFHLKSDGSQPTST